MSNNIDEIKYQKEYKYIPTKHRYKCSCEKFGVFSKNDDFDISNIDHFKQEGHQAINTMQEESNE